MKPYIVTRADQVLALASEPRSQIFELLMQGEHSVSELAHATGASSAATHYHVNHLLEVGLAKQSGKRRVGPRAERLFMAVAGTVRISPKSDSREYMSALLELALSAARKLEKEIEAAYRAGSTEAPVRTLVRKGRVDPADMPRLQKLLQEAAELVKKDEAEEGWPRITLRTFVVSG